MCSPRTFLWVLFSILPAAAQLMAKGEPPIRWQVVEFYGKLPLSFEANLGQTDQGVKFLARGPGYSLFLTGDSAVLTLRQPKTNAVLRMKLVGANAHAAVAGENALPGKSNYFLGNDPKQWRNNVPTYASVKYAGVYPGIDLVYHGDQRLLEYDFVVAPGADPRAIDFHFQGARKLSVNNDGALVIKVGGSEVIEHAPVVYQDIGGQRRTVAGRYMLRGKSRVGFSVAEYDRNQPLVIDPTLAYSTYLGGSSEYNGTAIAVDGSGNAYVTGVTDSLDFPTTPGAFQTTLQGQKNAFVTKLNAAGSALVYSTYLGGNNQATATGIAIDAAGNAFITGSTNSYGFPTTPGAFRTWFGGGNSDCFVTKLNAAGSALVFSTYLGGSADNGCSGIAVDATGNAYVTGSVLPRFGYLADFPTTQGAYRTTFSGGRSDGFVAKLNANGSALVYSTYLGGYNESATAIAVDASGNAHVTGYFWPDESYAGAFVTKLNAAGSDLIYSISLGGTGGNQGEAVAVDASGNAYVTGYTSSRNFPTTPGAFQTTRGGGIYDLDGFVTKLNASGSIVYSTYLGGSIGTLLRSSIAVDASGNAYVAGSALTYVPTTPDAYQTIAGGSYDAFVSKLNATGSALLYSTLLGASQIDGSSGIAIDGSGSVYVTGSTSSSDFPTTSGAFQTTFPPQSGFRPTNAFVSKLSFAAPLTIGSFSGTTGNNGWYVGPVTVTLRAAEANNPLSAIYYSLDGGTYLTYLSPFSISNDGIHRLLFYGVDAARRQEGLHGEDIKIDSTAPVSYVTALPATAASPTFFVQWLGWDTLTGLRDYTIYVSDNGAPFTPWLSQTTATYSWFAGFLGHTYSFYSIARDNAGNQQFKTAADATAYVPQMPGDANGDGQINCADIAIVKASFGKRTGQPGFDPRADINGDGVVDVRDLATVSQKLIPGTSCP